MPYRQEVYECVERTGSRYRPLFELLEARGFKVWLVEPGQLSRCGARPETDVLDCQWIQRVHSYGLLEPSFRPPDAVLALRGYHRQRQMSSGTPPAAPCPCRRRSSR